MSNQNKINNIMTKNLRDTIILCTVVFILGFSLLMTGLIAGLYGNNLGWLIFGCGFGPFLMIASSIFLLVVYINEKKKIRVVEKALRS